jgi:ABC-type microcin C transport system duplicated ATPase subunit YejF
MTNTAAPTKSKSDQPILLEVKNLKTWFPIRRGILQRTVGHVKAVDDVSFFVRRGGWGTRS